MTTAEIMWGLAVAALLLAVFAGWAERKRSRRANFDRPGFMPWNLIQVIAAFCIVIATVLAIKG